MNKKIFNQRLVLAFCRKVADRRSCPRRNINRRLGQRLPDHIPNRKIGPLSMFRRGLTSDYKRFPLPSSSHRIFIFNLQSLIDDPVCDLRSKKWKRLIVCLLFSFVFLSSYTSSLTFGDQSRVMIIELSGLVRRCVKMKKKQPPEGNTWFVTSAYLLV